jgi:signal transduction histidine kinase
MLEVKLIKRVKLHIIDQGIGMTADEEKYINQPFLVLKNFRKIQRHKDSGIIGHLVLVLLCWSLQK